MLVFLVVWHAIGEKLDAGLCVGWYVVEEMGFLYLFSFFSGFFLHWIDLVFIYQL